MKTERILADDTRISRVPAHVDPALVIDFDYLDPPGIDGGDVYRALSRLHDGPDIVWTPHHGGHWIATRAEDIKWLQDDWRLFSSTEKSVPRGSMPFMPPLSVDPPDQSRFRAVLNPHFARRRIEEGSQAKAREVIVGLIEAIKPRGECEFVGDFAYIVPLAVFFDLVDLPIDRREEFLSWGRSFNTPDPSSKMAATIAIVTYLNELLESRLGHPGSDIFTAISQWRRNPRFKALAELTGMAQLVFLGGQDTVASLMSFALWRLAEQPGLQRRLQNDPAIIPAAVEEILRRHGLSITSRLIMQDIYHKGAHLKAGDMILEPNPLSGIDPRMYDDPFIVDFDRGAVPYNSFGHGAHRCVGEHLARMELRVLLEEWSKRMPIVSFNSNSPPPKSYSGGVIGVSHLHLAWET